MNKRAEYSAAAERNGRLMKTVSVIGGDLRALTLARLLGEDGYKVTVFGFDKNIDAGELSKAKSFHDAMSSEVIILPMPVTNDNISINAPYATSSLLLEDFFAMIGSAKLVLAGHINAGLTARFDREGIVCIDYYNREELVVKNAVPTAEGALEIAISEMPTTISGSKALVIGYGRIGKIMSRLLSQMGAKVTVSARSLSDLAWIDSMGYESIKTSKIIDTADKYDVIFNTVPSMVLGEEELLKINENALIIDLASVPGGVDLEVAKSLGRRVIWALSLPGKTAPITAGRIIKETVKNILDELEVG